MGPFIVVYRPISPSAPLEPENEREGEERHPMQQVINHFIFSFCLFSSEMDVNLAVIL